jgi:hypothetical protein
MTRVQALLAELRRDLRPLGRRARRRALDEARDHLLTTIEDELEAGASPAEAEQRAVERFGDPAAIAERLCAVRPRRSRRAVPALAGALAITGVLVLAVGPIGDQLAPHPAAAAAGVASPSERECARAFDAIGNASVRAQIELLAVRRVQIFATTVPNCVIKFELADQSVLTAEAPWKNATATGWVLSTHPHGNVFGQNGAWKAGRLTATGASADVVQSTGPPPSAETCVTSWNGSHPPVPGSQSASRAALVSPLSSNVFFIYQHPKRSYTMHGPGCAISVRQGAKEGVLFYSQWSSGSALGWQTPPIPTSGLFPAGAPNATLRNDGQLTLDPISIQLPPAGTSTRVREISSTGWAGGFQLHRRMAQAIARFGPPSSSVAKPLGCEVTWKSVGLVALFFPGIEKGPPRRVIQCSKAGIAISFSAAGAWKTPQGLRIGASVAELQRLYPGAGHEAAATNATTWYLSPRRGNAGTQQLSALVVAGHVRALVVQAQLVTGFDSFG